MIELESSNALASLEFGATDLAIRLAQPTQAELMTRKLAPVDISVFISAAQLGDRDPRSIKLDQESIVWIDSGLGDIAENRLIEHLGIGNRIVLRASSVRALALACSQGEGLAMLPNYVGAAMDLIALPHISVPNREVWLLYHPETRLDPVMRGVRDWVVNCFTAIQRP